MADEKRNLGGNAFAREEVVGGKQVEKSVEIGIDVHGLPASNEHREENEVAFRQETIQVPFHDDGDNVARLIKETRPGHRPSRIHEEGTRRGKA